MTYGSLDPLIDLDRLLSGGVFCNAPSLIVSEAARSGYIKFSPTRCDPAARHFHHTLSPPSPFTMQGTKIGAPKTDMTEEVLLLDDDPAMLVFLEGVLGSAGYACHTEVDPESALTRVAATPDIGLILSDVCMPGLTGLQFIGRLHALPLRWPTPKVVLLTAHPSLEAAIDALRLGAQDFLLKPIRPPALIDAIDRALERSRADRVADPGRPPEMRELVRQAEELAGRLRSLAYANSPYAHAPRRATSRAPHRTATAAPASLQHHPVTSDLHPATSGALAMEVPQGRELLSVLDTIEQLRRLREHYREHQLDDLEWELLLELLRAERMHQPMSVSRLTSSTSAASTSTSLRRINHLVSRGYFTRTPDEQDARRDFVALTSKSNLLLADYLARANAHLRDLTG